MKVKSKVIKNLIENIYYNLITDKMYLLYLFWQDVTGSRTGFAKFTGSR